MENFSQAINTFDHSNFMGKNGFVWWYGVVEDRKDPLYIGRVKVRIIGWHTDDKTPNRGIPTEELPWAEVIQPINSATISGIGTSPTGMIPGTHVFGFFRDGVEAQEPVVLGTSGGVPERFANSDVGFFDPRSAKQRERDPYPPLFIQRTNDGSKGTVINHPKAFSNDIEDDHKVHIFEGESKWADKGYSIFVKRDEVAQKSVVEIRDKDDVVQQSSISYSPHPDENRTRFDASGNLLWSLPSTNILASSLSQVEDGLPFRPNPFATLWLRTHRMNGQLLEYSQRLHSKIFTSVPDINWTPPGTMATNGEPVYPFNHVNYTESGHLFEMDDTPGKERIRLLHRSTSYMEFASTGDRIDNTIGEQYNLVDSNIKTHALGNIFTNVGGYHDLYVNGVGSPNKKSYNVRVKSGTANIETSDGDINIIAGGTGVVTIKGADVRFDSGSGKPISQKTFDLEDMNIRGTKMGELEFNTKNSSYRSDGKTTVSSSAYSLTTGDYNLTTNKTLNINATMGSREIVNGIFTAGSPHTPGTGKEITTLAGKMEFNTKNPVPLLTGFEFKVGPTGNLSKMISDFGGFNYTSPAGSFDVLVGNGFSANAGAGKVDLFAGDSLSMANLFGEVSIDAMGVLTFMSKSITLGSVLSELMAALKALTVPTGTGPSGPPINASALEAVDQKLKQMLAQ